MARSADWKYYNSALLDQQNPHLFFEGLASGSSMSVRLHLIIPTTFGLTLNVERNHAVAYAWDTQTPRHANKAILYKQEYFTCGCALCKRSVTTNERIPYQVALRIIITTPRELSDHVMPETLTYDVFMCILCRKCQNTPWHTLIPIHDDNYSMICASIATCAFSKPLTVPQRDPAPYYLERLGELNDLQLLPHFLYGALKLNARCIYCGCTDKERLTLCPNCLCVSVCCSDRCIDLGCMQHTDWMCERLREVGVFDVAHARCVDETGSLWISNET